MYLNKAKLNLLLLQQKKAFLKCSNHWKQALKMIFKGRGPTLGYRIALPSLQKFVTVVHGSFYSYIKQQELIVNHVPRNTKVWSPLPYIYLRFLFVTPDSVSLAVHWNMCNFIVPRTILIHAGSIQLKKFKVTLN